MPTRFQTWPLRNYVTITSIKAATETISQNPFRNFSDSFGIESYTPVVPSKIIPDSRPKWAHKEKKNVQKEHVE